MHAHPPDGVLALAREGWSRREALRLAGAGGLVALLGGGDAVGAQDATPAAGTQLAPGVVLAGLGSLPTERVPGHSLQLLRLTFDPGGQLGAHRHPGTILLSVQSGSVAWTLLEGQARVLRGVAAGQAPTEPPELITEPGTEVVLQPGDVIAFEREAVHAARNAGDEPAEVLAAAILEVAMVPVLPVATPGVATPSA